MCATSVIRFPSVIKLQKEHTMNIQDAKMSKGIEKKTHTERDEIHSLS